MPPATVEEYLAALPSDQREALEALRTQIRAIVPGVEEFLSYGVIGFRRGQVVCHIGAAKNHCALYGAVDAADLPELAAFKVSKGTIRFQPEHPIPQPLLERIIRTRLARISEAAAKRKKLPAPRPGA